MMKRREPGIWEHALCRVQGLLFELAWQKGYDMRDFIDKFMTSATAAGLDESYNPLQWAGEAYILEELESECKINRQCRCRRTGSDALYWAGYLYRYWHYYTGESSVKMYRMAGYDAMVMCYPGYHTLACEVAIDWLREESNKRLMLCA